MYNHGLGGVSTAAAGGEHARGRTQTTRDAQPRLHSRAQRDVTQRTA
jgi:hypothetical protein